MRAKCTAVEQPLLPIHTFFDNTISFNSGELRLSG